MKILIKYTSLCLLFTIIISCNNGGSSTANTAHDNVTSIIVDSGYNESGSNIPYVTVTICKPGTLQCQVLDHVILDTGSTGFKIDQSQLTLNDLPIITYSDLPLYECALYGAGYLFGSLAYADIKLSGETAINIPIEIINDGSQDGVPTSCSNGVSFVDLSALGAKAIIGINVISNPNNTYFPLVYTSSNQESYSLIADPNTIPVKLNVNPIAAFIADNNGAILQLPFVDNTSNTPIDGTLTFGLNTQADNIVSESIYKLLGSPNQIDYIGAFIADSGELVTQAIFDSGTPVLAFYSTVINQCPESGDMAGYYCPDNGVQLWTSILTNYSSGVVVPINELIESYAFSEKFSVVPFLGYMMDASENLTIYGLPAFFGRSIYLGFEGNSTDRVNTPLGMAPAWGFNK